MKKTHRIVVFENFLFYFCFKLNNCKQKVLKMSIPTGPVKAYLARNWFKLSLAALLIFVALKKDLSFNIRLSTPLRTEEPSPYQEKVVKRERYTDNQPAELPSASGTEYFDLGPTARSRRTLSAMERLAKVDPAEVRDYIGRFRKVAAGEERKFGIPAAITLANAMLHSQAGTAPWAQAGRDNHFLLDCTKDWQGAKKSYDGRCLREYENAWTSFRDHSFYITTGAYSSLRSLDRQDLAAWAQALEDKGFSQEDGLAKQLLGVIEQYGL